MLQHNPTFLNLQSPNQPLNKLKNQLRNKSIQPLKRPHSHNSKIKEKLILQKRSLRREMCQYLNLQLQLLNQNLQLSNLTLQLQTISLHLQRLHKLQRLQKLHKFRRFKKLNLQPLNRKLLQHNHNLQPQKRRSIRLCLPLKNKKKLLLSSSSLKS